MSCNKLTLKPSYWASVSGHKDSLYMLKLLLSRPDLYPLDGVVHFSLDICFPWENDVIAYMEAECKRFNIPFVSIAPDRKWIDWYLDVMPSGSIRGFPTRKARWCNQWKLTCKSKLIEFQKSLGYSTTFYIGYCYDESGRYKHRKFNEIYPLVDFCISEDFVLNWARSQDIFNHYYWSLRRAGCMYCPMISMLGFAYLFKYYPYHYSYMLARIRETERLRSEELGKPFSVIQSNPRYNADWIDYQVKNVYLDKLEFAESGYQLSFFTSLT